MSIIEGVKYRKTASGFVHAKRSKDAMGDQAPCTTANFTWSLLRA